MQAAVNNNSNAVKAIGVGYEGGSGTDESGLSVYLGGYRSEEGGTHNAENMGVLWCSTEFNELRAYRLSIANYDSIFSLYVTNKDKSYSVRCVKD